MDRAALIDRLALLSEADATSTAHFQQVAAATHGLGVTEMRALSILAREGPHTAGALIGALQITSGAVTGVIDRLVARGVARRTPDPDDRRKVIVTADLDGFGEGANAYAGIGAAFAALYDEYTDAELEFLARHLEASVAITARETARLRGLHAS